MSEAEQIKALQAELKIARAKRMPRYARACRERDAAHKEVNRLRELLATYYDGKTGEWRPDGLAIAALREIENPPRGMRQAEPAALAHWCSSLARLALVKMGLWPAPKA